jgi:tetratricopeptide (TPR) repeat protein
LIVAFILAAIVLLTYANSLSVPFLHDGVPSIQENPHITNLWPIWEAMRAPCPSTLCGRPVSCLSFALNHAVSGLDVCSYHLLNILFHLLAALLLFGIVRRTLLSEGLKERLARSSLPLALAAAAIWLVHPLHTTAVTYLVQRTESLMGMFYLLTLYSAIRAFTSKKGTKWYALSILACVLGMGAKEAMITAPLVILAYDRIFASRSFKDLLAARWLYYLLLFASWSIVLAFVFSGSRKYTDIVETMTRWQYFVTQLEVVVAYYLKLSFVPYPLVFDYGAPFKAGLSDVLPYALFIVVTLAATVWALFRRPRAGFLGFWFFANLALTSSVLKIASETIAERRMYLSLAAVAVGTVIGAYLLLERLLKSSRAGRIVGWGLCSTVVLSLGAVTYARNRDFKSAESLWLDTVSKQSQNARAWYNLGSEYTQAQKHQKALSAYDQAVRINPGYTDAFNRRGVSYGQLERHDLALKDFERAIELQPDFAEAYVNRATAHGRKHRFERALADLDRAIDLNPNMPSAYRIRGSIHGMMKNPDLAISDLGRAIELNPKDAGAYADRGSAYANKGDFNPALDDLRKSLRLNPNDHRVQMNLAKTLSHLRRSKEAIPHYRQALRVNPNHAKVQNDLAFILATHPEDNVRNGAEAIQLAQKACELTKYKIFNTLETLAAAYAATGRFEDAIETAEKARSLAESGMKPADATRIQVQLNLYRRKLPYRKLQ